MNIKPLFNSQKVDFFNIGCENMVKSGIYFDKRRNIKFLKQQTVAIAQMYRVIENFNYFFGNSLILINLLHRYPSNLIIFFYYFIAQKELSPNGVRVQKGRANLTYHPKGDPDLA